MPDERVEEILAVMKESNRINLELLKVCLLLVKAMDEFSEKLVGPLPSLKDKSIAEIHG